MATVVIKPQEGPQEQFLATSADICIYGGSAGGGKTFGLLLSPLRYKNTKGFGCVVFRRNFNQILSEGGLWDESTKLYYRLKNVKARKSRTQWEFNDADGRQLSKVSFAHIERDKDVHRWQGSQICEICCEENTPVLMADGSYKLLKEIRTGDFVQTLNGPCGITAVGKRKLDKCVLVELPNGKKQIHTTDHKILTKNGWVSYDDIVTSPVDNEHLTLPSTGCCTALRFFESTKPKSPNDETLLHKSSLCPRRNHESSRQVLEDNHRYSLFEHISNGLPHSWICEPIRYCFFSEYDRYSQRKCRECELLHDTPQNHQQQGPLAYQSMRGRQELQETSFCKVLQGQESYYESYLDCNRVLSQLLSSRPLTASVSQVHTSPSDISHRDGWLDESPCAPSLKRFEGCQGHCSCDSCPYDEHSQKASRNDQAVALQLNDVVVQNPTCCSLDAGGKAPTNNCQPLRYEHPYTGVELDADSLGIDYCSIKITPIGKKYVIPITVSTYNHYITECGLVNKNCFDELTHFSEYVFFYMLSRNRSVCGVKPFVRATCNPDSDSWVAKFIEWWIDQDTGYAIPERSGKIRWMIRRNNVIHWADTKEELYERFNLVTKEQRAEPKSVTFIASSIYDNKILLEQDPGYLANLKALALVEQERLLHGNWKIKPAAGLFFKRTQVGEMLAKVPPDIIKFVRGWDLAATAEDEGGDPAYTAGVLMGKRSNGRYVIIDVINERMNAGDVRKLIRMTAEMDRARYGSVRVRLPKDPGQAGKAQAQSFIKYLAGFDVCAVPESGSKDARAEPVAAQWQAGNFDVVVGDWNEIYFSQLESFPASKFKDMVDATSSAFAEIEESFDFSSLIM